MNQYDVIPMCNVSSSKLTQYYYYTGCRRKRTMCPESLLNLKDNKVKGSISQKSSKSLTLIINNWFSVVYFKMLSLNENVKNIHKKFIFITLTLSAKQNHEDKFIRRYMLNNFIIELKRKYDLQNYIHVSEAQENGNIHFHILIDKYIHHEELRNIWNKIQDNYGYIDEFEKKHGHRNPNSTDIHSLRKINNIPAYLVKYFTKDEKRRKIDGRLWGCSDNLRDIKCYNDAIDSETEEFLSNLKLDSACRKYYGDYWSIWEFRHMINYLDTSKTFIDRVMEHYLNEYEILLGNKLANPATPARLGILANAHTASALPASLVTQQKAVSSPQLTLFAQSLFKHNVLL